MARATIFHSQHVMVEPLQAETVEAGPIAIETDGKGGGKVVENGEWPVRNRDDLYYPPEIDGMESLLLALACEGVKVTGPRFRRAVETTLDAIDNNADDPDDF
jgi:hypothetical protein